MKKYFEITLENNLIYYLMILFENIILLLIISFITYSFFNMKNFVNRAKSNGYQDTYLMSDESGQRIKIDSLIQFSNNLSNDNVKTGLLLSLENAIYLNQDMIDILVENNKFNSKAKLEENFSNKSKYTSIKQFCKHNFMIGFTEINCSKQDFFVFASLEDYFEATNFSYSYPFILSYMGNQTELIDIVKEQVEFLNLDNNFYIEETNNQIDNGFSESINMKALVTQLLIVATLALIAIIINCYMIVIRNKYIDFVYFMTGFTSGEIKKLVITELVILNYFSLIISVILFNMLHFKVFYELIGFEFIIISVLNITGAFIINKKWNEKDLIVFGKETL